MFRKKNRSKKHSRAMLSAYSIIMILIILLGILSHVLPKAKYAAAPLDDEAPSVEVGPGEWENEVSTENTKEEVDVLPEDESFNPVISDEVTGENLSESRMVTDEGLSDDEMSNRSSEDVMVISSTDEAVDATEETFDSLEACEEVYGEEGCAVVDGSGVVGAKLYQVLMAPILGFENAIDVCIFVMVLGGFLAIMAKTKALETGIKILVKKMHGKEYLLILLLMFIFSILGTTYGFLEESVGFYVLIAATMFAAGMDPLVGVATILLGAGSGVLGSTINPFATGVAVSAMKDAGIEFNQGTIILIAVVLWLTTLAISAFFVVKYAKKVQRDKGSTFLSLREQAMAEKKYAHFLEGKDEIEKLTGKQIASLIVFGLTFW